MSLQRRGEKLIILYVFKIKNKLVPNDIGLQFMENSCRSRLQAIVKPMPKIKGRLLTVYENSFTIQSAKLWNKLPYEIAVIESFNVFKTRLDDFLKLYPDRPPVSGYYNIHSNSLLDYTTVAI